MKEQSGRSVHWDTSASGEPPVPSEADVSALREQLEECRGDRGRSIPLRSRINNMDVVSGNRTATVVMVVILFFCAVSLLRFSR